MKALKLSEWQFQYRKLNFIESLPLGTGAYPEIFRGGLGIFFLKKPSKLKKNFPKREGGGLTPKTLT